MAGLIVAAGYVSTANASAVGAQLENGLGPCDYAIDAVELVAGVTPQLPIVEVFDCMPCKEGYYKDVIGSTQCVPSCARGTYQNSTAATRLKILNSRFYIFIYIVIYICSGFT